jgi:hypothetical protein
VNTDASAQATVDASGGDSRPGLSPGWVVARATILALAIRLFTLIRRDARERGLSARALADRHGTGMRTVRQALRYLSRPGANRSRSADHVLTRSPPKPPAFPAQATRCTPT